MNITGFENELFILCSLYSYMFSF